jgi:hypothetical protein
VKPFLDILRDEGKLKTWHDAEVFLDMSLLREVEKKPGANFVSVKKNYSLVKK